MSDFTGPVTTNYDPNLTPEQNVKACLAGNERSTLTNAEVAAIIAERDRYLKTIVNLAATLKEAIT